jgi:hypothetical protein
MCIGPIQVFSCENALWLCEEQICSWQLWIVVWLKPNPRFAICYANLGGGLFFYWICPMLGCVYHGFLDVINLTKAKFFHLYIDPLFNIFTKLLPYVVQWCFVGPVVLKFDWTPSFYWLYYWWIDLCCPHLEPNWWVLDEVSWKRFQHNHCCCEKLLH